MQLIIPFKTLFCWVSSLMYDIMIIIQLLIFSSCTRYILLENLIELPVCVPIVSVAMTGRRASAEARRAPPGVVGAASAAAGEVETWSRGQRRSRGCPSDIGAISVRVGIVIFLGVTPSSRTSGMRHKISPSTQILHGCLRLPRTHPPHVATGSALLAEFSNILAL
jgi:hypothetical protein